MRILGNILLIPLKIILFISLIAVTIALVIIKIVENLSTMITGFLIFLLVALTVLSFVFYGSSDTGDEALVIVATTFGFIFVVILASIILDDIRTNMMKALAFWF